MSADGTRRDGNATENIQSVQQISHSQSKKERTKERKREREKAGVFLYPAQEQHEEFNKINIFL